MTARSSDEPPALLIRRASLAPGRMADVVLARGAIVALGEARPAAPPTVPDGIRRADLYEVDLDGRPLLPGLADHHIHLMATAAARRSVDLGPAALAAAGGLVPALRAAREAQPDGWLRAIGYDVDASGPLHRDLLDAAGAGPVRVQDRTGGLWILDGVGLDLVLPAQVADWPDGVECDPSGRPTGVLVRLDRWLRDRLGPVGGGGHDVVAELRSLGRWLAVRGVTAVTDAGAANGQEELALLAQAELPQHVMVMTRDPLGPEAVVGSCVMLGSVKVLLDDDHLPPLDELTARVAAAHAVGRGVAVHAVTPVQVVLALAAGLDDRDRIEHANDVPDELLPLLAASGVAVVVQPGLVTTRGDRYLQQHAADELPALHRLGSFLRAGIPLAASSDAPYGSADPWVGIAAGVSRLTSGGRPLGVDEAVAPQEAIGLYLGDPQRPGRSERRVIPGVAADLVVLDDEWSRLAHQPPVKATLVGGHLVAGALDR